ncbi:IS256 family transposase [Sulfobacillus sp. hq2]|uniref:IS256 family transposase n=1 Tax=Sulfobacillus TaxID=28033 RepID=UPI000CD2FA74|nr:IS256 family transposase [Sulfobacillus sp. hq2]POB09388.1 IS256 family transposase [Sulfobacillus sp. hq2]
MTTPTVPLLDLLRKAGVEDTDFLREAVEWFLQQLMEAEVTQQIGAGPHERTGARTNSRNGHRPRTWETRVGAVQLAIPKLRQGTYYPEFLEPRRRSEHALVAVIQEAYVHGVSTRKVDQRVQSLGMTGISKSQVSQLCQGLDERVTRFKQRPLEGTYPYVWLDAKYLKVRDGDRVVSMAFVVATGVAQSGDREILGFDIGLSEDAAFWTAFLRDLVARGLRGVQLVISDAHTGLQAAIRQGLQGTSWQRCRVHFMRNLLAHVPKQAQTMVSALVRTIFAQPDQPKAREELGRVADHLAERFPQAAALLADAEDEVLAYMGFPHEHWKQMASTNPLERLNREIGRRADVVGIFPNRAAALRLVGAVLMEYNDEWAAFPRRYFSQTSMAKLEAGADAPEELRDSQMQLA